MAGNQIRILGSLEVEFAGEVFAVSGARQQTLLTMLVLHANEVVPVPRLVEAMWDDAPPSSAMTQVRICVSRLRRLFARKGMAHAIRTRPSGYLLRIDDDGSDLARFERLMARSRAEARAGRVDEAAGLVRAALALWRGPAAGDLESPLVQATAARVNEERLTALEEYFDLELGRGRHRAIIGELFTQVAAHPFREHLTAQLMLALYRSGRQAEALDAYQGLRRRLDRELGIEPGTALRGLQDSILAQDSALAAAPDAPRPPRHPAETVPAQRSKPLMTRRPSWDRYGARLQQLERENAMLRAESAAYRRILDVSADVHRTTDPRGRTAAACGRHADAS
ncbi:BTAD domain-containing putative transcriptional regulator [Streptantibioticus rubrisoli]|uniref:AfsR/SARP family transcriptional regulator n=1 Tax=Streptantibioticus rubrisoli TaxID=1387313 RepID=A0ABT1P7W9_9ACTN|nr:AfsR/SARP family transcriptional regulator [Streptantibioticus rubrisoli]MCQ4041462.1 AfsR/SARP family transcriptional regulator [Streptantibioticus rubrisoli]